MSTQAETIMAANLARVEERIQTACAQASRSRDEVTLVAVSKTRTLDEIAAAVACGALHLGENRIEELEAKVSALTDRVEGTVSPTWHMIGHIQSRKAARVAAVAGVVHSVDSIRLARRLDRAAAEQDRSLPVLIEVNVSGEEAKYGFAAHNDESAKLLIQEFESLTEMPHLCVRGLMTMAPYANDPEETRPVFGRLARLRDRLRCELDSLCWDELSMGMTNDYVVAIQEGATMVRIGRAIFGDRVYMENDKS